MYVVSKSFDFCYGHRLMNFDGPCMHPHGHNAKVEVFIKGDTLDKRHILFEFSDLENQVKGWIDNNLDHRMLLFKNDPLVKPLQDLGEPVYLFETSPTAEAIAKVIFDHCMEAKLPVDEIRVWETETSYAAYRNN